MALSIRLAQVVRVYPRYRACEIVFLDDGCRVTNAPVLSANVSSDTGGWSMHNMPRPPSEEEAGGYHPDPAQRTVMAVVAMVDDRPLILGFMPHAMSQMAFVQQEQNRDIWRHPSGTLQTTNRNGSWELQHTGGAFVRVAAQVDSPTDPDRHEDLTPFCWNENWLLPENDPATVTVATGDRDGGAMKLRSRPNGDIDQMSSGYWHSRHQKDLHFDIGESSEVHILLSSTHTAGLDIKIRTPMNVTVTAGGDATVQALGNANVYAGQDVVAAAVGNATVAAGASATVEAVDEVKVGSEGPVTIASGTAIFLAAPVVVSLTAEHIVTGSLIEGGSILGILGAVAAEGMAAVLAADAAIKAALAAAGPPIELALAAADLVEAALNIEEAVVEAVETTTEAVGLAPMDNLGGTGPGDSSAGDEDDVVE